MQRLIRKVLTPWLDERQEQAARQHSDDIHRRSIEARIKAERVRAAYQAAGERLQR